MCVCASERVAKLRHVIKIPFSIVKKHFGALIYKLLGESSFLVVIFVVRFVLSYIWNSKGTEHCFFLSSAA